MCVPTRLCVALGRYRNLTSPTPTGAPGQAMPDNVGPGNACAVLRSDYPDRNAMVVQTAMRWSFRPQCDGRSDRNAMVVRR
eukprot:gene11401-biopygen4439